jgi:TolB-like protein
MSCPIALKASHGPMLIRNRWAWVAALSATGAMFGASGSAAGVETELRTVAILDIVNVSKNRGYDYLENSITDAFKKALARRFEYQELEPQVWRNRVREQEIPRTNLHEAATALKLGQELGQEVVFTGSFVARRGAKKKEADTIELTVRLISVAEERMVKELKFPGVLDGNIFETIDQWADQISKEAAVLLPSFDEARERRHRFEEMSRPNNLVFRAGYISAIEPTPQILLNEGTVLTQQDGNPAPHAELEFRRFGLFLNHRLGIVARAGFSFFYRKNISVINLTDKVSLSGFTASGLGGLSWRFRLGKYLYLLPQLLGGYAYSRLSLSHPVNASLRQEFGQSAPLVDVGLIFGVKLSPVIHLEIFGDATAFFYQGQRNYSVTGGAAVVWRMK